MKHSFSVSELQTICSVHIANDPSQVVSVHYVRDSGVVSVEVQKYSTLNMPSAKALDIVPTNGGTVSYTASQRGQRGCTEQLSLLR